MTTTQPLPRGELAVFGDVLDSPSGRYAQLCIIADSPGYPSALM